jgi:hypothetical protein
MAGDRGRRQDPPRPTFVFKGTIRKLNPASTKQLHARGRTAVTRVDQVIEASGDLARLAGQDITVQLSGRAKIPIGRELIFQTIPVMYGDSVLVQSVKQEPVTAAHAGVGSEPNVRKASRELQDRLAAADLVVSGRVTTVSLPPKEAHRPADAATSGSPERPITEHDPEWRDAVVTVAAVHKGHLQGRTLVVRFPGSTDVRWYRAPKFHPGQEGFFMLQIGRLGPARGRKRARVSTARAPLSAAVYTALDPADFQPYSQAEAVKTEMLAAAPKRTKRSA